MNSGADFKKFPPFVLGSDTSEEAAESVEETTSSMRLRVYNFIVSMGVWGSTCDWAEHALKMSHQTCSARFNELRNAGKIVDSGRRRKTRSGRNAAVYVVAVGEVTT